MTIHMNRFGWEGHLCLSNTWVKVWSIIQALCWLIMMSTIENHETIQSYLGHLSGLQTPQLYACFLDSFQYLYAVIKVVRHCSAVFTHSTGIYMQSSQTSLFLWPEVFLLQFLSFTRQQHVVHSILSISFSSSMPVSLPPSLFLSQSQDLLIERVLVNSKTLANCISLWRSHVQAMKSCLRWGL